MRAWIRGAVFAALLLTGLGCGGGDRPKLVPVTGKVVRNGQPVLPGNVVFHPEPGLSYNGDRPSCQLQTGGTFTMLTYPHGEGVPPGKYKVTLSPDLAARIKKPEYGDPAKTPWAVDVPDTGLPDHVLEVK
jgi:hypothetical protein